MSEEPGVRSSSVGLDIDLEPADVWTLGQLIEAETASFPPTVEREIMRGYRILQAGGYDPQTGEVPDVDVTATGLPRPRDEPGDEPAEADPRPLVREVVLGEVRAAEPGPRSSQAAEGRTPSDAGPAQVQLDPGAEEELDRLAEAVDELAARLDPIGEGLEDVGRAARTTGDEARGDVEAALVDAGLVATAALAAAVLAVASAALGDPVFAVLALVLVAAAGPLAYPYLSGGREGAVG